MNIRFSLKIILFIIPTLMVALSCYAQRSETDVYLDSLRRLSIDKKKSPEERLQYLEKIAHDHYDVDSTIKYASYELRAARKLKNASYEMSALRYLGWAAYYKSDYVSAIKNGLEALAIADSLNDEVALAKCYRDLGNSYNVILKPSTSNAYYSKALDLMRKQDNPEELSSLLRAVGMANINYEMFSEAEKYYNEALDVDVANGSTKHICDDYLGLGIVDYNMYASNMYTHPKTSLLVNAKNMFSTAYESSKVVKNFACQYNAGYHLASTMLLLIRTNDYGFGRRPEIIDSCRFLVNEAKTLMEKYGAKHERMTIDVVNCQMYAILGQYERARRTLDSLDMAIDADTTRSHLITHKAFVYRARMELAFVTGDHKAAFSYLAGMRDLERSYLRMDKVVDAAQSMVEAEFDNKMRLRDISEARHLAAVRFYAIGSLVTMILLIVIAVLIYSNSVKRKRANEILDQKNRELEDSIRYASVIQKAVMPSDATMTQIWGESLVALRPLHIVSGDFFWTCQVKNYKVLVVGDCTGHGVPGAFLSMLGMILLEYISTRYYDSGVDAGKILDEIRRIFRQSLHRNAQASVINDKKDDFSVDDRDSIDMALCLYDVETGKMHFAGAFRPMVLIRKGELIQINGDRMPVGEYVKSSLFTNHEVQMEKGDVVYLYSDGLTDQFGYDDTGKLCKYGNKRLQKLLLKICDLPFMEQKRQVGIEFARWRMKDANGGPDSELYDQTDDALIVGVKL